MDRKQFEEGEIPPAATLLLAAHNGILQYVPAPQESVIGLVVGRSGEGWRVDIGSAHSASLDGLAFEGATKRNRPNLKVRDSTG